jgi:hypothetical protein
LFSGAVKRAAMNLAPRYAPGPAASPRRSSGADAAGRLEAPWEDAGQLTLTLHPVPIGRSKYPRLSDNGRKR